MTRSAISFIVSPPQHCFPGDSPDRSLVKIASALIKRAMLALVAPEGAVSAGSEGAA